MKRKARRSALRRIVAGLVTIASGAIATALGDLLLEAIRHITGR